MSANANPLWLEYELNYLTLQNGRRIFFPRSSRMLYEPDDHVILIETTRATRNHIVKGYDLKPGNLDGPELKRIEYAMLVNLPGVRETLRFFHPMKPGNGVRLAVAPGGELVFFQQDEKPLFSKDYTLRDVSRGAIDSDRAVWQFHGYRHEH